MRTYLDEFTEDELERFNGAISDALFPYGAENQDLWDTISIPVGRPVIEPHEFPVEPLANACRAAPVAQWKRICSDLVERWITSAGQREWIAAQPFADIAGSLRPWLSHEREFVFKGDADGPEQPWAEQLLPGCWLSLFVDVPSLGDGLPALREFVPNKAVAAWDVSLDELLDATRRRLRTLPPPKWESDTFERPEDDEVQYPVELWYLEAPEDTDPIPAAWQLILVEVAPRPLVSGTLITAPARQTLLLSYPDPALTIEQRRATLDQVGDHLWGVYADSRVQGWDLRVDRGEVWHIVED